MGLRGDFISDGKLQAFWTEMINKEQTNRAEWLVKHKSLMDKCVNRKPKEDRPDTAEMVARIRKLRGPTIPPPIKHTRKQFTTHFPDIKQLPPSELEKKFSEMDMKKAEPEVKKELYQGLSHFGEGRYRYLKKRQEIRPELKWNYTVTSGHEYGWKNTTEWKYEKPKYGRGRIIQDSFYRKTGVMGTANYLGSKQINLNRCY